MIEGEQVGKKLTYDYVKKYIESFGYSLLSEEYIAVKYKLKFQCDKGHEYEATFNNFQRGTRCPICNDTRYTYEYVKKYIDDNGYKLLSNEYINNVTKIELM